MHRYGRFKEDVSVAANQNSKQEVNVSCNTTRNYLVHEKKMAQIFKRPYIRQKIKFYNLAYVREAFN